MKQPFTPVLMAGCLLLILSGCGKKTSSPPAPPATASLETDPFELRELKTISSVPAEGITGPNDTEFFIKTRSDVVKLFPCSTCHEGMDPIQTATGDSIIRTMHVDIELQHASPDAMNCTTCHSADDPGTLHTLTGRKVELDHAYQLCAQCHFEQQRDWAGGAHGKRLAGWKGKRVVNNCTECHDPHSPSFKQRIPHPGPLLPNAHGGGHHD